MTKKILVTIALIMLMVSPVYALTKFDFLTLDYQDCGITSCRTYYTAKNPTGSTITVDTTKFNVSTWNIFKGQLKSSSINYWNGTAWTLFGVGSLSVAPSATIRFYIEGKFTPVYGNNTVSYSIDHVPSYKGFTYPEYDLWNQSFNKCFEINLTYNLKNYTMINETFPVDLRLNSTNINLTNIRSDWGDLRFGNGTCSNVSGDYKHNIVFSNATTARVLVYVGGGAIQNNTVTKIVAYYNNSGVTHVEPTNVETGLGNNMYSYVKWFSNDKTTDTNNVTNSIFNDSTTYQQYGYGTSTLVQVDSFNKEKQTLYNNATYQAYVTTSGDLTLLRGVFGFLRFRLYNAQTNNKYSLMTIKNLTDSESTNIMELYIK